MSEQTEQPAHCQWSFTDPRTSGRLKCDRQALAGCERCLFHKPEKTPQEVEQFREAIRTQVEVDENSKFEGYRFPPDWDYFQERTLPGADFRGAEFEGDVEFFLTHFDRPSEGALAADFARAHFGGSADFRHSCFGSYASFWSTTFGGDTYFSDARFGGSTDFGAARFDGGAHFGRARFDGSADFAEAEFGNFCDFMLANLNNSACFRRARFGGLATFDSATFAGYTDFTRALFSKQAFFTSAVFQGPVHFVEACFADDATLMRCRFDAEVLLYSATFLGLANLVQATFSDLTALGGAVFHSAASFAQIGEGAGCRFLIPLAEEYGLGPRGATLFARPDVGAQLCRLAKETAKRTGDDRLAGECFYYERMLGEYSRFPWLFYTRRRRKCEKRRWRLPQLPKGPDDEPLVTEDELKRRWLSAPPRGALSLWAKTKSLRRLCIECGVYGYGERPWRVLGWSVGIVCLWAILYWWFGLVRPSASMYPVHGLLRNLYFSVVTFTTLGFGDFEPVKSGPGMFLAASEAFIGMFMIALFVVSLAKRFSRG